MLSTLAPSSLLSTTMFIDRGSSILPIPTLPASSSSILFPTNFVKMFLKDLPPALVGVVCHEYDESPLPSLPIPQFCLTLLLGLGNGSSFESSNHPVEILLEHVSVFQVYNKGGKLETSFGNKAALRMWCDYNRRVELSSRRGVRCDCSVHQTSTGLNRQESRRKVVREKPIYRGTQDQGFVPRRRCVCLPGCQGA